MELTGAAALVTGAAPALTRSPRSMPGRRIPLIGLVDTFGKVVTLEVGGFKVLPELSSMTVYVLMAAILLWRPEGLFGKKL